jgi:hypothetical protein
VTYVGYKVLTTVILVAHFSYLAYLVVGGFLAWRWPKTIYLHVLAAAWGLTVVAGHLICPLTYAENWSRRRAGQAGISQGFIDHYIEGVLYPARFTPFLQALLALLVIGSWVGFGFVRAGRRRRRQASRP